MKWSGFRKKLCLGNILCNNPEFLSQDRGNQQTVLTLVRWSKFEFRLPDEGENFFPSRPHF